MRRASLEIRANLLLAAHMAISFSRSTITLPIIAFSAWTALSVLHFTDTAQAGVTAELRANTEEGFKVVSQSIANSEGKTISSLRAGSCFENRSFENSIGLAERFVRLLNDNHSKLADAIDVDGIYLYISGPNMVQRILGLTANAVIKVANQAFASDCLDFADKLYRYLLGFPDQFQSQIRRAKVGIDDVRERRRASAKEQETR